LTCAVRTGDACHEKPRRRSARRAAAAFVALLFAGCGDRDDVLHLYTSLDAQEAPVYIAAFEKDTGVRVRWVRLSAGEALARLEAERSNPQVAVWFGGPAPEYIVAAQRSLLEPMAALPDHLAAYRGAGDEWAGFYFGALGFICNEPLLQRLGAACPDSWAALLRPELRGQISVAYPYTSGTAYVMVVALLELLGEEAGWEYIRSLDAQIHRYNSSGTAAVTQVGMGEAAVGIAFSHDILKKGIERGYPVTLRIPQEGTAPEIGAVALVRGGPGRERGEQFVAWLLSERAQNLLAEFYRVPLHPDARVAEGAVTADDVRLIPYDAVAAAADQQRILSRWRRITGR
jgi:iron(III) transport system substrate-binding protein